LINLFKDTTDNFINFIGYLQCLQPKDGLGYGWVWVFAAPVWVGFRFLFFKKPDFRLGFRFFKIKKKRKFLGKIVMKEEKNLRKSFNHERFCAVWETMVDHWLRKS
jgi:hypothetical protein